MKYDPQIFACLGMVVGLHGILYWEGGASAGAWLAPGWCGALRQGAWANGPRAPDLERSLVRLAPRSLSACEYPQTEVGGWFSPAYNHKHFGICKYPQRKLGDGSSPAWGTLLALGIYLKARALPGSA
jgi:hypothetical protein